MRPSRLAALPALAFFSVVASSALNPAHAQSPDEDACIRHGYPSSCESAISPYLMMHELSVSMGDEQGAAFQRTEGLAFAVKACEAQKVLCAEALQILAWAPATASEQQQALVAMTVLCEQGDSARCRGRDAALTSTGGGAPDESWCFEDEDGGACLSLSRTALERAQKTKGKDAEARERAIALAVKGCELAETDACLVAQDALALAAPKGAKTEAVVSALSAGEVEQLVQVLSIRCDRGNTWACKERTRVQSAAAPQAEDDGVGTPEERCLKVARTDTCDEAARTLSKHMSEYVQKRDDDAVMAHRARLLAVGMQGCSAGSEFSCEKAVRAAYTGARGPSNAELAELVAMHEGRCKRGVQQGCQAVTKAKAQQAKGSQDTHVAEIEAMVQEKNGNLAGVDLSGKRLRGVNLTGVDLTGAKLQGTLLIEADLSGATLTGADLSKAELSLAMLDKTNLTKATLSQVKLQRAQLLSTNLDGAQLDGASFVGTQVSGGSARGASLIGVTFSKAKLSSWDLEGATLERVTFEEGTTNHLSLTNATLKEVVLNSVTWKSLDARGLQVDGWEMTGGDLDGADFRDATFRRATFNGATFTGDVSFRSADVRGINFCDCPDCTWRDSGSDKPTDKWDLEAQCLDGKSPQTW